MMKIRKNVMAKVVVMVTGMVMVMVMLMYFLQKKLALLKKWIIIILFLTNINIKERLMILINTLKPII